MRQAYSPYDLTLGDVTIRVTPKRVKNVNFRIGRDGRPLMSVPVHVTRAQAEAIARERLPWFEEHLARAARRRAPSPEGWEDGDTLRVWGEPRAIRLRTIDGRSPTRTPGCTLGEGELVLHVPEGTTPARREGLVEGWLRTQINERLTTLLPACEARVGRSARSVSLRRMRSRWGSCTVSKATIRLNTALAECPPRCLETVLVHELCHLIEPSHGPRFYALMDLHCPDWRVWQGWLDEHPPRS